MKQNSLKAWLLAARPKTLTGAAVPVLIGLALAYVDLQSPLAAYYPPFNWTAAVLCLLFAEVMQVDANFINDFFDYARGNDDAARRLGPLRACTQGWVSIDAMKRAIALTTVVACLIGLPLIWYGGWEMVIVGLFCVICCFLYTTHLSYMGLGDVLVLLFFGIVPVCVTYYSQLHTVTWQVFIASVACGLVVDGLLIINNYRDRANDLEDGKLTLVVKLGAKRSRQLFLLIGIVPTLMGVVFWLNGHLLAFVLPFIFLVFHFYTYLKVVRIHHGRELNTCLAEAARNILIYGVCVAAGLLIG